MIAHETGHTRMDESEIGLDGLYGVWPRLNSDLRFVMAHRIFVCRFSASWQEVQAASASSWGTVSRRRARYLAARSFEGLGHNVGESARSTHLPRREYNTFRPHNALGYRPPAPETVQWPWPRDENLLGGLT